MDDQKPWVRAYKTVVSGPLLGLFTVLGLEIYGAALTIPVFSFFCIHELHLNASSVGILISAFNLAQALGGPTFGRVSDAFGRRTILLLCFFWSSTCFLATSAVVGFWDLLVVRCSAGLSGGSIPVAAAMIMDCASPQDRPAVLGIKGAVLGLTFTGGPLTVVGLLHFLNPDRRNIFILAGFFCGLGFFLGLLILKESLPPEKRRPLCSKQESSNVDEGDWAKVKFGLVCAWISRFFYAFTIFCLYSTYAFLIKDNFGWSDREFGMILACGGVFEGLLQLLLYPVVSKCLGEHVVCVIGFAVLSVAFIVFPTKSIWIHFLALAIFNIGQCFLEPGLVNLTGYHAPSEKHMGFAQGMSNGFRAMASVIGPFTAGKLYDITPLWVYLLGAGMAVMGAMFVVLASLGKADEYTLDEKQGLLEPTSTTA